METDIKNKRRVVQRRAMFWTQTKEKHEGKNHVLIEVETIGTSQTLKERIVINKKSFLCILMIRVNKEK